MCGISGIINKSNQEVNRADIVSITDVIAHRGPDASGYFLENNLALGHRRLSIIDLSEQAHQPLIYNNDYILVFNGEIYNYIEIKKELVNKGYLFNTHTDSEVLIAAYLEWGFDCLPKFNGMWSFALYDKKKNILFCSRDRFGIKPFYYADLGNKWVFGSEISQLLEAGVKPKANMQVLADYLVLGMEEHRDDCFFDVINKLKASHYLVYDLQNHQIKTQRYYELKDNSDYHNISESDALNTFVDLFSSSINLRLRSDVKVGTCLSGGLDSSYVASIASELYHKSNEGKFTAITAKSSDKNNDETAFAEIVSKAKGLDWRVVTPSNSDFINGLKEVIKVQEEPFGSPSIFMQYYVMQEAARLGCKVMLDGQGGDETLFGYERYYPAYISGLSLLNKFPAFLNSGNNSRLTKKQLLQYMFYFSNPKIRETVTRKRFSFLNKELLALADFNTYKISAAAYSNPFQLQKLEVTQTQLPHLLKYEDRNSMHHAVEARLPFLDYRMVELSLSLPIQFKINNGWTKYILRKAVEKELPKEISWRTNKFGFEAPENVWLSDKETFYKEIKASAILAPYLNKELSGINNRTLWRLFNIAIWEKIYNVGTN